MSDRVEAYETVWDESEPCPKCGCRVLKLIYCTVYDGDGPMADYSHDILNIQCPNCDYDVETVTPPH